MPKWSGRWKGGRYYTDAEGRDVYFIERDVQGKRRSIKLRTHDEELAVGELARFTLDPVAYCKPPEVKADTSAVFLTEERINLYLASIRSCVKDHRNARRSYLLDWAELGLDLRSVDRKALRIALADFEGGHAGRTEALNACARFLVKEGELIVWNPLVNTIDSEASRAERQAYTVEELQARYRALLPLAERGAESTRRENACHPRTPDVLLLRAETGMHQTEVDQIAGARVQTAPLPDKGIAIRTLGDGHEIRGVIQVMHKSRRRHRQPVGQAALEAALRLREGVPSRTALWEALDPIIPSNLRHTFVTLSGEVGEIVTYVNAGVDRARIAQAVGHRAGSTMTADRYDKLQVPPMIKLPFKWD